jgi:hypothetical protein
MYNRQVASVVAIQAAVRGCAARRDLKKNKKAVAALEVSFLGKEVCGS